MKVSLVLATIGRTQEVGRLVESLLAQTDSNFELLVMDQNQDDRLACYLEQARSGGIDVSHHRMETPGLSSARNKGIGLARHEIVAFPDDDCWYEPTAVERVRQNFIAMRVDGIVARWVEQSGDLSRAGYRLVLSAWRHYRGGHASSISLFLGRALLVSLGGFDERLGVGKWYGAAEEIDLVLRALSGDAQLEYVPDVEVRHAYPPRADGVLRDEFRKARQRSRGTGAIYAKHALPLSVILRGVAAPIIKTFLTRPRARRICLGIATSVGRIEGYARWTMREQL